MQAQDRAISGHVRIEERKRGPRVWVAKYQTAAGRPTRRVLGPAWAKEGGRRTERGAPVYRTPDGPKPDGYLSPKDARQALDALLVAERDKPQTNVRHHGRTFQDAVDEWLRHREKEKECAETTMRDYRATAERDLIPFFGADTPLRRIGQGRVDALRTHLLSTKRSPRTAQKAFVLSAGIFGVATRRGWIPSNPHDHVEKVGSRKRSTVIGHVLPPDQVYAVQRALVDVVEADELADDAARAALRVDRATRYGTRAAAIVFAAFTGLRTGELRALRWEDIDFANGWVRVRRNLPSKGTDEKQTKGGEGRSVPLIPQAAKVVEDLSRRGYLVEPGDRVFPGQDGHALEENALRNALYDGLHRAGLGRLRDNASSSGAPAPFRFHDLRHTFGTLAAQAFPLRDVQAYLGHADIETTQIYLHHVPSHDHAAKLGALVAAAVDPLGLEAAATAQEAATAAAS